MKYMKLIFFITASLLLLQNVYATTYYVSKSGNDTNLGTSWGSAWAEVEYGMDQISCGDTLLIGTGTWYRFNWESSAGWTSACGNGDWTVIACSSFVATNDADRLAGRYRAKLFGGQIVTGWTQYSGNVYRAPWAAVDIPTDPLNEMTMTSCYTLGQLGGGIDSLMIPQTSIANISQPGEFYHDDAADYLYVWAVGGGDPDNNTMIASVAPVLYFGKAVQHVKFWGLDLQYGKKNVISWGNDGTTDSIIISNCNVSKSGALNGQNGAVIGSKRFDGDGTATHTIISACSIGVSVQTQDGGPSNWFAYNQGIETYSHEFITVESCYFYGTHANAIYFKNEFGDGSQPYTACVAKFNTIVYPPNSEQEGSKAAIQIDEMPDRDSVYGNVIVNANYGVRVSFGSGDQASYESICPYRIFIANNTFINVEETYFRMGQVPSFNSCGSENKFMYNVCYGHQNSAYLESSSFLSFRTQHNTNCQENAWVFDSNSYYDDALAFGAELYPSYGDMTFSQWQASGRDVHSFNADCGLDTNLTFTLPDTTSLTMNMYYGGRTWTRYGAKQPGDPGPSEDPYIGLSRTTMSFNASEGDANPAAQTFNISNLAGGTLNWSIDYNSSWLNATPLSGTGNGQVTVSTDISGLSVGTYRDTIMVSGSGATNSPVQVIIQLTIQQAVEPSDNFALGITPTVSGSYPGYNAVNITDGDTSTTWASNESSVDPHWVVIDFGTTVDVKYVKVCWAYNSGQSIWMRPQEYQVQSWNGSSYINLATIQLDTTNSINFPDTVFDTYGEIDHINVIGAEIDSGMNITEFASPVQTSRIRIYQPANMGPRGYSTVLWISEIEIYYNDICPPQPINTLGAHPGFDWGEIYLAWIETGDDNRTGSADRYDIKISESPITLETWSGLPLYNKSPVPDSAGRSQVFFIDSVFDPYRAYYIAMKACDELEHESGLSNVCMVYPSQGSITLEENSYGFALATPGDNGTVNSLKPTFVVHNADSLLTNTYFFEFSLDESFTGSVISSGPISQNDIEITTWRPAENLSTETTYYWRAKVNNADFAEPWSFSIVPIAHAFPNPFALAENDYLTIAGLPEGASLSILSVSGSTIKMWSNISGGEIQWDGTNESGETVASGVYLWNLEGSDVNGKIVVIR
ncbi:MAG: discoidin domain-containing protein [Candidatus Zixiibacteriota bacterium]